MADRKQKRVWTEEMDKRLAESYPERGVAACSELLGVTHASVRQRASRLGLRLLPGTPFNKEWQARAAATKTGRKRPGQAEVIREMFADGRLSRERTAEQREKIGAATKARIAEIGHPKGMLGKKHSESTKEKYSAGRKERWASLTQEERDDITIKQMKAKSSTAPHRANVTWKGGWREVAGRRIYFRSNWEANYARYLQHIEDNGGLFAWDHEPDTFWFDGIKRGCVSYLPDFKVWTKDGDIEYHEVKGWMDDRSKTKIARMAKYHPSITLKVIDSKSYKELESRYSRLISDWER